MFLTLLWGASGLASAEAQTVATAPLDATFAASAFHRVAASGSAAGPAAGVAFTSTKLVGVMGDEVAIQGAFVDPTSGLARSGLYAVAPGGAIRRLADASLATPGGETIESIVGASEWIDNQLTFAANTSAGQKLYRLEGEKSLVTLFSAGDAVGSAAPVASFASKGIAGDGTGYAFSARLADGTQALYQSADASPASAMLVADDKVRSPVPETGLFVDFPELAYRGRLTAFIPRSLEADNPGAGAEPVGVVYANPGNPTRLAAFKHAQIPGSPDTGFSFNEFEKPRLFDDSRLGRTLGFTGGFTEDDPSLTPPGETPEHFMGVFTIDAAGSWKNWINSDIPLPGLRDEVAEFNGFAIDGASFAAGAVDEAGGRYIFTEIDGEFRYVLSTYDLLDGKSLSAIRWTSDDIEGATLYFSAEFTDGSSGVYSVIVPEPATLTALGAAALLLRRRRR